VSVVVVKPGDGARLAAALTLLNRTLGEQIFSPGRLAEATRDAEALLTVWDDGDVQGAAVARLLYPDDDAYYAGFGPAATALFRTHRVGSLEALAVMEDRRHQGIGRQLTLDQMSWLARQGCDVAVAVSWLSGGTGTSAGMYRDLGFQGTPAVADFYFAESVRDGWTCPSCQGPCHCAAAFFWRALR
jgi:GNAT superfamily N-acetyltransferase